MSFTNIFRGARGLSQPPIDDIETYWSPMEKAQAMRMLARSIVGSRDTVRAGIEALVAETSADELIVVSDVYDHAARLRSFELIAQAADADHSHGGVPPEPQGFVTHAARGGSVK
jgi:alkanesulfonate monooxygenase SsuD/methylene tetrahydromethanopterin reductase-like flavin-dependent oxidoreductase (luciferase family)